MTLFDDQPLSRTESPTPEPPEPSAGGPPGGTAIWIGGAVAVAVLLGAAARWWTMERTEPVPANATPVNMSSGTDVAVAPPAPVLPPIGEMDPFLRVLLGTLSARPELSRWLATDDLIRQMAVIIDRLSQGASPAKDLRVLMPAEDFETTPRGQSRIIDPASYRRYDGLADTVASLDAAQVARVYRTIKPRLGEAYRAMGRQEGDLDNAVAIALETLAATPVVSDPIAVLEGKGATWAFADPKLEELDPAQKQLLRMGPANAARVQAKLREIESALRAP